MNKIARLLFKSAKYALEAEATLRSDMAKRIMYSVIPSLADQSQIYHTQGVVDYKALAAAIEGRHDIIRYGAKACAKEMEYYYDYHDVSHEIKSTLGKKDYGKVLDLSIKGFSNYKNWSSGYGGAKWEQIAKTAKQLYILDENLMDLRTTPKPPPDYYEQEVEIMKQIVIALNVFDGLAHNSASIMNNMVNEEATELYPGYDDNHYQIQNKNMNAIRELMDAKEINDPIQVFKIIEPELIGSGDIHRYKDWTKKLRSQKEYRESNEGLIKEKFLIRIRKELMEARTKLNVNRESLEKLRNELVKAQSYDLDNRKYDISSLLGDLFYPLDSVKSACERAINAVVKEGAPKGIVKEMADHISSTIGQLDNKRYALSDRFYNLDVTEYNHKLSLEQKKQSLHELVTKTIELYNAASFYLDSI